MIFSEILGTIIILILIAATFGAAYYYRDNLLLLLGLREKEYEGIILRKNSDLKLIANSVAGNEKDLFGEFQKIEDKWKPKEDPNVVNKTNQTRSQTSHNRYRDISAYQENHITLSTPCGKVLIS